MLSSPLKKERMKENTSSPGRTPLLLSALTKHSWDSSEHEQGITARTSSSFAPFGAAG